MEHSPRTLPAWVINLFFAIGVASAVCFRVLIIVQHVRPDLFRLVWYVGVVGYIIFFMYRYIISQRRRQVVEAFRLTAKIEGRQELQEDDRLALLYVLGSIRKSRENMNYLVIFILSLLAMLADLLLTFNQL